MSGVTIRTEGRAGRITLERPEALNALTDAMCRAIDAAFHGWRDDRDVALVMIDGEGARAFCAGGDITEMYETGQAGDFGYGQRFWADEYRMNAYIARYPKPVVSFLHGLTLGGGVGLGCHGHYRVAGETTRIAMPECAIGLVPDTGGSLLLARAPGRLGAYLGTTGARMAAADALFAGFADAFVPEERWPSLKAGLMARGDAEEMHEFATEPPEGTLTAQAEAIDRLFAGDDIGAIIAALESEGGAFVEDAVARIRAASPLSVVATLAILREVRANPTIAAALEMEYRFVARVMAKGDFLEGIRAALIDRDRKPRWRHARIADVTAAEVAAMLAPLDPGLALHLPEDEA